MKLRDLTNEELVKKQKTYGRIKTVSKYIYDIFLVASCFFTVLSELISIPTIVSAPIALTLCAIWFFNLIPLITSSIVLAKINTLLDDDEDDIEEDIENVDEYIENEFQEDIENYNAVYVDNDNANTENDIIE